MQQAGKRPCLQRRQCMGTIECDRARYGKKPERLSGWSLPAGAVDRVNQLLPGLQRPQVQNKQQPSPLGTVPSRRTLTHLSARFPGSLQNQATMPATSDPFQSSRDRRKGSFTSSKLLVNVSPQPSSPLGPRGVRDQGHTCPGRAGPSPLPPSRPSVHRTCL